MVQRMRPKQMSTSTIQIPNHMFRCYRASRVYCTQMNKSGLRFEIPYGSLRVETYNVVLSASVKLATRTAAIPKPWHTKPTTIVANFLHETEEYSYLEGFIQIWVEWMDLRFNWDEWGRSNQAKSDNDQQTADESRYFWIHKLVDHPSPYRRRQSIETAVYDEHNTWTKGIN